MKIREMGMRLKYELRNHCTGNLPVVEAGACYPLFISNNVRIKSIKNSYNLIRKRTIEEIKHGKLKQELWGNESGKGQWIYEKKVNLISHQRAAHIKTTGRHHCTPTRMIKISKSENSVDKGLAQWKGVNWYTLWKTGNSYQNGTCAHVMTQLSHS